MRMTSKKNLLAVTLLAAVAAGARAEGPKVSGFVDVGYNYNLNNQMINKDRVYDDNANTITLQNAKIGIDGTMQNNVGYKVDVMYGHDASINNQYEDFYNPDPSAPNSTLQLNLEQAYLTFPCPITGATFTLGKFVSPFGFETIEAKDDYNISRGLLFNYAVPFSHTGLKADRGFMDGKLTGTLGLVNGWNNMQDNNKSKAGIVQVGTTLLPKTSITLGGFYGAEQDPPMDSLHKGTAGNGTSLFDAIVKVTPIDKLTLVANYDAGEEKHFVDPTDLESNVRWTYSYQGLGLHANYQITDMYSVAGRWETFDPNYDMPIRRSETLTAQAKKDGVIYRLEYRADHSTQNNLGVLAYDGKTGTNNRQSQATIGAQVIVTF